MLFARHLFRRRAGETANPARAGAPGWRSADQYSALPELSLTEDFQVARIWFTTASGSGT